MFATAKAVEAARTTWHPLPGPQTDALNSKADILFYGGAAGGGKTDLLLGAALQHKRSIIFRREFTQLTGIIDRSREIYGAFGSLVQSPHNFWRLTQQRKVEFGSCQHVGDERKYQGHPHDLIAFDELPHFAEIQFRTLMGWLRSTNPRLRVRVIAAGNPPMNPEEEWVVQFWAPWLDPTHPNPARPGELRYFAVVKGVDKEMPDARAFVLVKGEAVYDFDPAKFKASEIIRPLSRTFIPASVEDNPFYMASGYVNQLAAMPEPLRSKLLYGDFSAGKQDNPWQVIPSDWVLAAQERWKKRVAEAGKPKTPLSALGVDVARGGKDKTILSPRYDNFFDEQQCYPGNTTPDGPAVAALVVSFPRLVPTTTVKVDIIGVGSSPYDYTKGAHTNTEPMNGAEGSAARDKSGMLAFINSRAQWWWQFREALDPASGQDICLPPDRELYVDLCTPRWKLTARGIQVEAKDDIIKRIKRSPDKGDSCVYAHAQRYYEGMGLMEVMREEYEKQRIEHEHGKGQQNGWH